MRLPDPVVSRDVPTPADEAVLADSVSLALLVVLDTLAQAERLAFVLHDLFDLPSDRPAQQRVVQAFFAAARSGDLGALVAVLDPEAVLRADGGASRPEVSALLRGAGEVARRAALFNQPGASVTPVLVNGTVGAVVSRDGEPISVMGFTISGGRITEIDILLDPERLRRLDLAGCLLAKAEAGLAVEQLTGDLQMAGVRGRLLDHVQDHHPDVGYRVLAVPSSGRVAQATLARIWSDRSHWAR